MLSGLSRATLHRQRPERQRPAPFTREVPRCATDAARSVCNCRVPTQCTWRCCCRSAASGEPVAFVRTPPATALACLATGKGAWPHVEPLGPQSSGLDLSPSQQGAGRARARGKPRIAARDPTPHPRPQSIRSTSSRSPPPPPAPVTHPRLRHAVLCPDLLPGFARQACARWRQSATRRRSCRRTRAPARAPRGDMPAPPLL